MTFRLEEKVAKNISRSLLSESSRPIYINDMATVKEAARREGNLFAQISAEEKCVVGEEEGGLNAFCLKCSYEKWREYHTAI